MSWRVSASSMASVVSRLIEGMAGRLAVSVLLGGAGLGEAVGVGAGFDDGAVEGEPVDDGGAEAGVGEGLGPAAERLVGGDPDTRLFLPLGQNLEQQFGTALVEFHIAQFVNAQQVDAAVTVDGLGELLVVGGLDQFVGQLG